MLEFFPFFLVMFVGVFFSMVFGKIHIPWVVTLIVGGMVIGGNGFDLVQSTPTLEFISQIGLIFLMFMAGLETRLSSFKGFTGKLFALSFVNAVIPGFIGMGIGWFFGYNTIGILSLGIIFIASSIAVVIPSLERFGLLHSPLGQAIVMTSVIQDVASLIFLSLLVQNIAPITQLPLYVFYPALFIALVVFRLALPRIRAFFSSRARGSKDLFQQEFRILFVLLLGTVLIFEFIGLHPIIAGFFAGLVLSQSIKSNVLKEKIRTISYGVFVPTFFITVGMEADINVLFDVNGALALVVTILVFSIAGKFFSGWLGGRMVGYTNDQALLFGVSSIPLLSTTLALAFTARTLGFIDETLLTAMILLSVVSTLVGPVLMNILGSRLSEESRNHMPSADTSHEA